MFAPLRSNDFNMTFLAYALLPEVVVPGLLSREEVMQISNASHDHRKFRYVRADCAPCILRRMVDVEGNFPCLSVCFGSGALQVYELFTSTYCEFLGRLVNVLQVS